MKFYETLESGAPPGRIKETSHKDAPSYFYYSQDDLIDDLNFTTREKDPSKLKQISTLDKIRTIHEGDLVFSLMNPIAALVSKEHDGYLITNNFVRIQLAENIYPAYALYYLNESDDFKKQIMKEMSGIVVKKITLSQFQKVVWPEFPSLEKQKIIGDVYLAQKKLAALKREKIELQEMKTIALLKKGERHV
jgi:restriction endonuclease S subunit